MYDSSGSDFQEKRQKKQSAVHDSNVPEQVSKEISMHFQTMILALLSF